MGKILQIEEFKYQYQFLSRSRGAYSIYLAHGWLRVPSHVLNLLQSVALISYSWFLVLSPLFKWIKKTIGKCEKSKSNNFSSWKTWQLKIFWSGSYTLKFFNQNPASLRFCKTCKNLSNKKHCPTLTFVLFPPNFHSLQVFMHERATSCSKTQPSAKFKG